MRPIVVDHGNGILENEAGDIYIQPRCPSRWDRAERRNAIELDGPLVFGIRDPHDGDRVLITHEVSRDGGHSVDVSLNLRGVTEEQAHRIVRAAVACGALSAGEAERMGVLCSSK